MPPPAEGGGVPSETASSEGVSVGRGWPLSATGAGVSERGALSWGAVVSVGAGDVSPPVWAGAVVSGGAVSPPLNWAAARLSSWVWAARSRAWRTSTRPATRAAARMTATTAQSLFFIPDTPLPSY